MSLITRCPACGTQFKVVSDQLRVSEGWVRCGQCSQVFDAQLHLQTKASLPIEHVQPVMVEVEPSVNAWAAEISSNTPAPDITPVSESADALPGEPHLIGQTPSESDKFESPNALDDVSFVRDARRQASWQRPFMRAALAVCILMLTCALALQVALQHQDTVSTFEPRLKPWLQQICARVVCSNLTPRRIDAIVIDSSSFSKTNAVGAYQLSFSLKNIDNVTVAMPAMEISLTDIQDQSIIRRVVPASQFGTFNSSLPANSEFSNTLVLQVQSDFPVSKITGYRLRAFYP